MKTATETLNPTRVKLTVEVPFEELQPSLAEAYRRIGQQINVPGFRRGKIPAAIVDQRIGRGAVLEEAINSALPTFYAQALEEHEVQPLSSPEVDVTRFADGESLEFTAELDVVPPLDLPSYEGLEATVPDAVVTDEDVDEQVEALRERFGTLNDVDRPAADGDFVTMDLAASQDGEAIEAAQANGLSYEVGRRTMLDGLDDALVGMSAGETKTFETALLAGDLAGQPVEVDVTVSAVQERELPELDDEFAQTASEFDTIEELREDLRDRLIRGRRLEQASAARDAALARLLELIEVPLPEQLVADELAARRQQVQEQLAYAGMTMEQLLESEGQTVEEHDAELEANVRDAIKAQFVLDEIARVEQIAVDESELTGQLVARAQSAGIPPEEYARQVMEHQQIPMLVSEVRRGKALARIMESAAVVDESGEPVELKRLQPDGTYADEPDEEAEGRDG